jgi:hypothetical protein
MPIASNGNKKQELAAMNGTCHYGRYGSSTGNILPAYSE